MGGSRRQFLVSGALGALGAVAGPEIRTVDAQVPASTPGAPPAFGTAPPVGPEVTEATIAAAEKLVQVTLSDPERQ